MVAPYALVASGATCVIGAKCRTWPNGSDIPIEISTQSRLQGCVRKLAALPSDRRLDWEPVWGSSAIASALGGGFPV